MVGPRDRDSAVSSVGGMNAWQDGPTAGWRSRGMAGRRNGGADGWRAMHRVRVAGSREGVHKVPKVPILKAHGARGVKITGAWSHTSMIHHLM